MFDHQPPTAADKPDCPHCAAARAGRLTGRTGATCLVCIAREIAGTPQAWAACRLGQPRSLQALIRDRCPGRRADGRRAVWDWCVCLGLARRAATNPLIPPTTSTTTAPAGA